MKIVEIYWMDTVAITEWKTLIDLDKEQIPVIKTVGYFIKKTKNHYMVCMSTDVEYEEAAEVILIPVGMVVKKRFLK